MYRRNVHEHTHTIPHARNAAVSKFESRLEVGEYLLQSYRLSYLLPSAAMLWYVTIRISKSSNPFSFALMYAVC